MVRHLEGAKSGTQMPCSSEMLELGPVSLMPGAMYITHRDHSENTVVLSELSEQTHCGTS